MEGRFTGGYWLRPVRGKTATFRCVPDVLYPLTFTRPNGQVLFLGEALEVDGATTPQWMHAISWLDPWSTWADAAVLHDWLWEQKHRGRRQLGFWASNRVLAEGCQALGLSIWKVFIIFWAVTLFGWVYWYRWGPWRC